VGRDSINGSHPPSETDFYAFFERISYRGTLVLQDSTVVSPLPFVLTCPSLSVVHNQISGTTELHIDDIMQLTCTPQEASFLTQLHHGFSGALHMVVTSKNCTSIPASLLNCLIALLTHHGVVESNSDESSQRGGKSATKQPEEVIENWNSSTAQSTQQQQSQSITSAYIQQQQRRFTPTSTAMSFPRSLPPVINTSLPPPRTVYAGQARPSQQAIAVRPSTAAVVSRNPYSTQKFVQQQRQSSVILPSNHHFMQRGAVPPPLPLHGHLPPPFRPYTGNPYMR
jgi:hypothetical protein